MGYVRSSATRARSALVDRASSAVFGARVRNRRERLGLSQEALAERAGLHWTFISGIERGVRNPSLTTVLRVSAALQTTAGLLLRGIKE